MLARAGHQPILIERTGGPIDKVCGDFLSQDTIKRAQLLGVDPTALGAAPIHRIRLTHGERAVDAALPFPALGLSRRMLIQPCCARPRKPVRSCIQAKPSAA